MARNSVRNSVLLLALGAICVGAALAAEETTVPAKGVETEAKQADPAPIDDESGDEKSVEDQVGFNTVEDIVLFRGPLATLWAAPQSVVASAVEWREVTPSSDQADVEPKK